MKARPTRTEALEQLDELYDSVPGIVCRGLCHDSCTVIDASELERERLRARGVELPDRGEQMALRGRVAAGERVRCPALSGLNTCRVYEVRPLICRVFGVTQSLRCEHGCVPEALISDRDVAERLMGIEVVSEAVTGVSRIPSAPGVNGVTSGLWRDRRPASGGRGGTSR